MQLGLRFGLVVSHDGHATGSGRDELCIDSGHATGPGYERVMCNCGHVTESSKLRIEGGHTTRSYDVVVWGTDVQLVMDFLPNKLKRYEKMMKILCKNYDYKSKNYGSSPRKWPPHFLDI